MIVNMRCEHITQLQYATVVVVVYECHYYQQLSFMFPMLDILYLMHNAYLPTAIIILSILIQKLITLRIITRRSVSSHCARKLVDAKRYHEYLDNIIISSIASYFVNTHKKRWRMQRSGWQGMQMLWHVWKSACASNYVSSQDRELLIIETKLTALSCWWIADIQYN